MNFDKMFPNLEIGKITDGSVQFSPLGTAIRTADERYLVYDFEKGETTDVTGMTLDIGMVFSFPISHDDLKTGDIIRHDGTFLAVITKTKNASGGISSVEGLKISSNEIVKVVPCKSIFGMNFFSKVMNPLGTISPKSDNPIASLMPFMLLSEGGDSEDLLPFLMLGGMGNGAAGGLGLGQMNPMMLMLMMSDKGGGKKGDDFFKMMMLSQLMGTMTATGESADTPKQLTF